VSKAPFTTQPHLTAVAIAYRNGRMIADDVLPRVPVSAQEFKYYKYTLADAFTPVDDRVGRKSAPNQVSWSATEVTDSTFDHALDDPVPYADIENARNNPAIGDPRLASAEFVTQLVTLNREIRTANLVFAQGTYASSNRTVLSGTSQWSDFDDSDPVVAITEGLDACIMRPNIGVFGRATWSKLSQHPKICKAVFGNNTDAGIVPRRAFADLFELDDIYVGEGFVNTAKKGQAATMSRVWGKHAAFIYRDRTATNQRGTTFGFTAQWGNRIAGTIPDGSIGMRGGELVRAGESVKEVVAANDLGYFFENAVA
jgi:hypothetical protein